MRDPVLVSGTAAVHVRHDPTYTSFAVGPAPVDELPHAVTVQQQQAEQMKVFWKVRSVVCDETTQD